MKKYLTGALAIVIAFAGAAFTKDASDTKALLYWYHTNVSGAVIIPGAPPPSSILPDPFNCGGGSTKFCSKGFSGYDPVTYAPVGSAQSTVMKPN